MVVAVCAGVCPVRSHLLPISELAARLEVAAPRTRRCLFLGASGGGLYQTLEGCGVSIHPVAGTLRGWSLSSCLSC